MLSAFISQGKWSVSSAEGGRGRGGTCTLGWAVGCVKWADLARNLVYFLWPIVDCTAGSGFRQLQDGKVLEVSGNVNFESGLAEKISLLLHVITPVILRA